MPLRGGGGGRRGTEAGVSPGNRPGWQVEVLGVLGVLPAPQNVGLGEEKAAGGKGVRDGERGTHSEQGWVPSTVQQDWAPHRFGVQKGAPPSRTLRGAVR